MQFLNLYKTPNVVETTAALLNDPLPPGAIVADVFSLSGRDPEKREEVFRGFLQELVQEWVRCGKKIVPKDVAICVSEMEPPGYSSGTTWRNDSTSKFEDENGTRDLYDPPYDSWLWRVYWDYLRRAKPNIWFLSDGEVTFNNTAPICGKLELPVALPPFLTTESPNLDCWMEAVRWFMLLLNSGYVQRLDRCAYCKRYFVRQREAKSGQVYKRGGANCGNCRGEVAKARTSDARTDAKYRMLKVAGEAWADWKKSNRTPDRYAAVANRVNTKCKKEIYITTCRDRIEPLWAKRNEKEIIARVSETQRNG
jgi:hypothetical protein